MILITPYGRYDRAAVQARAREIRTAQGPMEWRDALTQAYAEAATHKRDFFRQPTPAIAIRKSEAA